MRCLGVDLAVQLKTTGLCVLEWTEKRVVAEFPRLPDGDSDLIETMATDGDVVGIDVPLGWPMEFARAVGEYMAGPEGAWVEDSADFQSGAYFRYRETDRVVRSQTAHRATAVTPLSVSAEKLGATAMKAAWMLTKLVQRGREVDRSGMTGRVVEVYPAAAAALWGLQFGRYKNLTAAERGAALEAAKANLVQNMPLPIDGLDALRTEHQLDALICALIARAARIGMTLAPEEGAQARTARLEGWIHLPTKPLSSIA